MTPVPKARRLAGVAADSKSTNTARSPSPSDSVRRSQVASSVPSGPVAVGRAQGPVRVSLARTGHWLWNLGRVADGLATEDLKSEWVKPLIEEIPSGFGALRSVTHAAKLSRTPAFWARPAMPLGSHPPQWPPQN